MFGMTQTPLSANDKLPPKKSNRKDDPILNMTPKQVTRVRICQRLLFIAQQPLRTSM